MWSIRSQSTAKKPGLFMFNMNCCHGGITASKLRRFNKYLKIPKPILQPSVCCWRFVIQRYAAFHSKFENTSWWYALKMFQKVPRNRKHPNHLFVSKNFKRSVVRVCSAVNHCFFNLTIHMSTYINTHTHTLLYILLGTILQNGILL